MIDISLVYESYPKDRINTKVIYRFVLAQVVVYKLIFDFTIVKKIMSLSLLVGTTVTVGL